MVGITSCGFEILRYIGLNGPSTAYDMSKKIEPSPVVSDKTAYTLLPRLVKNGFLTVVTKKTRTRLKKEYSLTILGLSHVLYFIRPEELNPITESWGHLIRLVLEKYDLFVSAGFKDLVMISLFLTGEKFCKDYWSAVEISKSVANRFGESWRNELSLMWESVDEVGKFQMDFYSLMFEINRLSGTPKDQERLKDACKSDPDIRDYLFNGLTKTKNELRSTADNIEKMSDFFSDSP